MRIYIGTVSHGTMRSEDLANALEAELRRLCPDREFIERPVNNDAEQYEEDMLWHVDTLFSTLNVLAPEGYYFGAHEGDGADYGFWPASDEVKVPDCGYIDVPDAAAPTMDTSKWELLRHVKLDLGYTLKLYDANRREDGRWMLGYEMLTPTGEVLFSGDDYGNSPLDAIDSDDSLRALLSFLTLRPGDTDADYFEAYTEAQITFTAHHAEQLSMLADEGSDEYPAHVFEDIE